MKKLKLGVIPLLASPQGGVAASSIEFRAATEADAAGVVFLLFSIGKPPRPRGQGGFATLRDILLIARPPLLVFLGCALSRLRFAAVMQGGEYACSKHWGIFFTAP